MENGKEKQKNQICNKKLLYNLITHGLHFLLNGYCEHTKIPLFVVNYEAGSKLLQNTQGR